MLQQENEKLCLRKFYVLHLSSVKMILVQIKFLLEPEMKIQTINFEKKFAKFDDHWSPKVIAEMNDYQFKLVKFKGEFVWHQHDDTDETFIVLKGKMQILFKDAQVDLNEGEMLVVPKNTLHKPVAENECEIMLIEPRGVVNTGDSGGTLTAEQDLSLIHI